MTRARLVLAALALLGCAREPEPLPVIPLPADLPPAEGPLEERLRARAPTDAPLLVPDGPAFRATLEEHEHRTFTAVLRAGVCYKVLGDAEETVTDLDVLVYDANNVLMQRDTSHAPALVIGTERGICPTDVGVWRFELVAAAGAGDVIAQLWRLPM